MDKREEERLKKWMFCLNALDIALGSKFAVYIPEPIYVLLNDARDDLQYLFATYENVYHEPTEGTS